jgi:DNA polymerase III sliding clamp (beta) subunit (PCNA family)
LKDAIAKVKAAITKQGIIEAMSHYLVLDGMIYASDGRMVAVAPFPHKGNFLVPSEEFSSLVDRLPENPKITLEDKRISIRAGRMHGTIALLPTDSVSYPVPDKREWRRPPSDFLDALETIRPFISDNAIHPWSLCVALREDAMLATNNVVLAQVDCDELNGKDVLLPTWAVDYVLSREDELVGITVTEGRSMAFLWDDGSWMRSKLGEGTFPPVAQSLIDNFQQPSWKIPKDWRAAYENVAALSEGVIEVRTDKITGAKGHGHVEHGTPKSPAPEGGFSRWDPKFLTPVIAACSHWQPQVWPKPAYFSGPGIRGLISGRM